MKKIIKWFPLATLVIVVLFGISQYILPDFLGASFNSILWKKIGNYIKPANDTWDVRVRNLVAENATINTTTVLFYASSTSDMEIQGDLRVWGNTNLGIVASGTWQGDSMGFNYGGTGTSTWQQGSVVFAGASNLTEDNSNFYWDDTNNRLGIGTTTAIARLSLEEGTTAANGIAFGDDVNLYRSTVNTLKTDDSFYATGNIQAGGRVSAGGGSLSNPSFFATTDINTGMYFPAAETLGFVVSGTEKMRLTSSGYLGVGTTTAIARLSLESGTTAVDGIAFGDDVNLYRAGGNQLKTTDSFDAVSFKASGTTLITGTKIFSAIAGTAALPSYSFSPDLNTGMYRYGIDTLGWTTSGTAKMVLDANGYLGVGTTTPQVALHIGTSTYGTMTSVGNDAYIQGNVEVDGSIYVGAAVSMTGYTVSAQTYAFQNTSYGQITTASANDDGVRLAVGATNANNNFLITSINNTTKDHDHETLSVNPTLFFHSMLDPDDDNTQWGSLTYNTTTFRGFYNQVGSGGMLWGSSTTDWMVLNDSGYLGIGTTTPAYHLDVAGDINTTGTYRISGVDYGQYFINSAGTDGQLWASDGSERGGYVSTSTLGLVAAAAGATNQLQYNDSDSLAALSFGTSGQVLRSNGDGNLSTWTNTSSLGITASPAGSDKQIQFNDGGSAGADSLFTFNSSTNYMGIGTSTPAHSISVVGDINATGTYRIDGIDYGQYFIDSTGNTGQLWMSDGSGRGTWLTTSSLGMANLVDGAGIADFTYNGSTGATVALDTSGVSADSYGGADETLTITFDTYGRATAASTSSIAIAGSQITSGLVPVAYGGTNTSTVGTAGYVAFSDGSAYDFDSNLYFDDANGYLGIGTTTPQAGLHLGVANSTRSLTASNDAIISGKLEVDGTAYFDGSARVGGSLYKSDYWYLSTQSDDGTHLGIGNSNGTGNRVFSFVDEAYYAKNYDHDTLQLNPTVFIHSATNPDYDNTEWGSFSYSSTTWRGFYSEVGSGGFYWGSSTTKFMTINSSGYIDYMATGVAVTSTAQYAPNGAVSYNPVSSTMNFTIGAASTSPATTILVNRFAQNRFVADGNCTIVADSTSGITGYLWYSTTADGSAASTTIATITCDDQGTGDDFNVNVQIPFGNKLMWTATTASSTQVDSLGITLDYWKE